MNKDLLNKLLEYIDARIDEKSEQAANSSDGGLLESVRASDIRKELFDLANASYQAQYLPND
jgi:hypothetical protein